MRRRRWIRRPISWRRIWTTWRGRETRGVFCPGVERGSPRMTSWRKGVSGVAVARTICPILHCILISRISIIRYLLMVLLWSPRLRKCKWLKIWRSRANCLWRRMSSIDSIMIKGKGFNMNKRNKNSLRIKDRFYWRASWKIVGLLKSIKGKGTLISN